MWICKQNCSASLRCAVLLFEIPAVTSRTEFMIMHAHVLAHIPHHLRTYPHTHKPTHTPIRTPTHTPTHTHTHLHTHTHTYTHTHTHTYTCTHTHTHTRLHTGFGGHRCSKESSFLLLSGGQAPYQSKLLRQGRVSCHLGREHCPSFYFMLTKMHSSKP